MRPLKLHWATSKKNWGDWLSVSLCTELSGRRVEYARPNRCELVAIGSLLSRLSHGWFSRPVHVWGTGFISDQRARRTKHHIHAVRGKNSAELLIGKKITVHGDPGLLCDRLLPSHSTVPKKFRIGLIPHYKDVESPAVKDFVNEHPDCCVIDVFSETIEYLNRVAQCDFILSSSLHGLIAADSLGVPNHWIELSDKVVGNGFKFFDYYSVFDIDAPTPMTLGECNDQKIEQLATTYARPNLGHIKESLLQAFPFLP